MSNQQTTNARRLAVACGVIEDDGLGKHYAERLRLLEAVAKAARARIQTDYMGRHKMTCVEYLTRYGDRMSATGRAVLEALAALEALGEIGEKGQ